MSRCECAALPCLCRPDEWSTTEHRLELFAVACALCGSTDAYFTRQGAALVAVCPACDVQEIVS